MGYPPQGIGGGVGVIPDRSITRAKLEYPTVDVSFSYLSSIDQVLYCVLATWGYVVLSRDTFTDKATFASVQVYDTPVLCGRFVDRINTYYTHYSPDMTTVDFCLFKIVANVVTQIGYEAIDIDYRGRGLMISCSGSSIKSMRFEMDTPINPLLLPTPNYTISVTDTTFASGRFGYRPLRETYPHGGSTPDSVYLKSPSTDLPPVIAIIETEVDGDGSAENLFRPKMKSELVEISNNLNVPDFLKTEKKKYDVLKSKGFTDEEMKLLFGHVPQHQIDTATVSFGSFEFSSESTTNIITVSGNNPYDSRAIEKQIEHARSRNLKVISPPPRDYREAVEQFKTLSREFPHWLAGKDNYAYQVLGNEVFEIFQNIDFYYGEFLEHKEHYNQIKQVPDFEISRRLDELENKLSKIDVLIDERDKHHGKLREIVRRGW